MRPGTRLYLAGGLLLGLGLLALLSGWLGYYQTWRLWNITPGGPFMDVQVITAGADAYHRGLDPLQSNPTDVDHRPVNYPRLWHVLYAMGIDRSDTRWIGYAFWIMFGVGLAALTPPLRPGETGAMLAAVFSPAVMLALERGNTDLLMFFLLALAVVARAPVLSLGLVLLAFCLKLFPLAGLAILLGRGRDTSRRLIVAGLLFAMLYLLYNLADLRLISAATPRSAWMSYGWNVLWMEIAQATPAAAGWVRVLSALLLVALAVAGAAAVWWRDTEEPAPAEDRALAAFRLGAACYIGTYLLGNNFIYRLVFLLPVLPCLFTWARERSRGTSVPAWLALAGAYGSLWTLSVDRILGGWPHGLRLSFLFAEAAHWLLFGSLVWLFARTLPAWVDTLWRRQPADAPSPGGPA